MSLKNLAQLILFYLGHLSLMLAIYFYSMDCEYPKLKEYLRLIPLYSLALSGIFIMYFAFKL